MPLGEVARCFRCKVFASADELTLNREHWEYECKDPYECQNRQDTPMVPVMVAGKKRYRRASGRERSR